MKKILFILLIFLCSCSSTKKLEKSNFKSTVDSVTTVAKSSDEKQTGSASDQSVKVLDKKTDSSEKKNKTIETHTTDYDPSKPIVPGTNKPPVIKETIRYIKESNEKDVQIQETLTDKLNLQISYTRELQTKLDSVMRVNSTLNSKTSLSEKTVSNWYKWLIGGVGIGVIGLCLIGKIPFIIIFSKLKEYFNSK